MVETLNNACYKVKNIIRSRPAQILTRGMLMKYRRSFGLLQATVLLGVCAPAFAQVAPPPPPMQSPGSAPAAAPVLRAEPAINEPAIAPVPVVVPEPTPAPAPTPQPAKKKGPVDSLKPGQFVWEKKDVYEGPLKIVVLLDVQRMYVFQNDSLIGFTTISAGKKGKETPTGIFNILQKNIDHKSNLYSNAPMPYMQRLTWDGIALHAGHIPGYPASHGCIRMPLAFAKSLYGVTSMDQEVVVLQNTSTPVKRPEPKPVPVPEQPVPVEPVAEPIVSPQPVKT
jgi:lipoprotein-anchoring transpeptidase ErfK/SrfK